MTDTEIEDVSVRSCREWLRHLGRIGGTVTEHMRDLEAQVDWVIGSAGNAGAAAAEGLLQEGRAVIDYAPGNMSRYRIVLTLLDDSVPVSDYAGRTPRDAVATLAGADLLVSAPMNFRCRSMMAQSRFMVDPDRLLEYFECGVADAIHLGVLLTLTTRELDLLRQGSAEGAPEQAQGAPPAANSSTPGVSPTGSANEPQGAPGDPV